MHSREVQREVGCRVDRPLRFHRGLLAHVAAQVPPHRSLRAGPQAPVCREQLYLGRVEEAAPQLSPRPDILLRQSVGEAALERGDDLVCCLAEDLRRSLFVKRGNERDIYGHGRFVGWVRGETNMETRGANISRPG